MGLVLASIFNFSEKELKKDLTKDPEITPLFGWYAFIVGL